MKILVLGAGSIGSRHARNTAAMADVLVYDSDPARLELLAGENVTICSSLEDALAETPRAAIVATPHEEHVRQARLLVEAGCHVLVEKPLSTEVAEARQLVDLAKERDRMLLVVCNMRFHPGPSLLKRHLGEIGEPRFARAHFGQWLPGMRPGMDYRKLYCADAKAGGVVLDCVHEFDYLQWIMGPVNDVQARCAHISELEFRAEDYAAINLSHDSGLHSSIQLDYLRRYKRRGCELVGSEASLLWESEGSGPERCTVQRLGPGHNERQTLFQSEDYNNNDMYVSLIEKFIAAVKGEGVEDLLDGETALGHVQQTLQAKQQVAGLATGRV